VTAIAAIAENGVVYMGGDSAGVNVGNLELRTRKDTKVFKKGLFLIGFTTSFRMGQLLKYYFVPPEHPENMDIETYMNTFFIDYVKICFKNGGYGKIDGNNDSGGKFIVGYKGQLFSVDNDFQVAISSCNYEACGCGDDLCLGSLYTTSKIKMNPKKRIRIALAAAEEFSAGVRKPFNVLSMKG